LNETTNRVKGAETKWRYRTSNRVMGGINKMAMEDLSWQDVTLWKLE
jgi:hypothetical protein